MKPIIFLLGVIIATTACSQAPVKQDLPVNSSETPIVFRGVNVIPMDSERIIKNQVVVVKDGVIQKVGNANAVKYDKNALVIDAKGKYLMPGLAEMHAHVPPIDDIEPMKEVLLLFVTHGITTIRGMLGHPLHLDLRDKLKKGELTGPRFYTSGPSFSGGSVKTTEQAAKKVQEQKAAGYDFLKIHPGLSVENFLAIAEAAKKEGIRMAGHVPYDVGIWRAIDAEYETIDHLDGFIESLVPKNELPTESEAGLFAAFIADKADTTQLPKLLNALREHKVWVVPTQALAERWITSARDAESFRADPEMKYMNEQTLNSWTKTKQNMMSNPAYDSAKIARYLELRRRIIKACEEQGVGLLLGCDAPQVFNVPGMSTHHELQYLVDAGLTPYEALRTGTVNVAAFYERSADMGIIKQGAVADLVLLSDNPLEDISNSKKIEGVMAGNNWLSKTYIEKTLKGLEKN